MAKEKERSLERDNTDLLDAAGRGESTKDKGDATDQSGPVVISNPAT
jgi:hypothetical protein